MKFSVPDLYQDFLILEDDEDDEGQGKERKARVKYVPPDAQGELGFSLDEDEEVDVSFKKNTESTTFFKNGKTYRMEYPRNLKDKIKKRATNEEPTPTP
jgi:hypothetical protein